MHTSPVPARWNAVFCDRARMYRRTSVRKYASEIAVSSIGSEPSERSRKGRRLRGNGDLERGQPLEELRRLKTAAWDAGSPYCCD